MNLLSTKTLFRMKHYCFPSTNSTAIPTKKIKQFFSDLGFVCSFFLLFFSLLFKLIPFISTFFIIFILFSRAKFSILMENLRPRFEAPDEEEYHDADLEAVESVSEAQFHDPGEEGEGWEEGPDGKTGPGVGNSSSFNGGIHVPRDPVLKTHSLRHDDRGAGTNYEHSQQPLIGQTLSDLGPARKEREWRRTLACKLLQDGCNVAGEGMDRLWEVYERTEEEKKGRQTEEKSKSRIVDYLEEVEEEEEGEEVNLCCLKALKLSAGKMHFGMGRPGFLSFSKAVKGIRAGWSNHNRHHYRKKKA